MDQRDEQEHPNQYHETEPNNGSNNCEKAIKNIGDIGDKGVWGCLEDVSKIYEVKVYGPDGKLKRVIDTPTLLIREAEIDKKKRNFNASI